MNDLFRQANSYMKARSYNQAQSLYETLISQEPQQRSHYWHLGLALLLQGQEEEAQLVWLTGMTLNENLDKNEDEFDRQIIEGLVQVLEAEAIRQENLGENINAWAIRHHIAEIYPKLITNLIQIVHLSIKVETLTEESLVELGILNLLLSNPHLQIDSQLILQFIKDILSCDYLPYRLIFDIVRSCLPHIKPPEVDILTEQLLNIALKMTSSNLEIVLDVVEEIVELCLYLKPQNLQARFFLTEFYIKQQKFQKALESSEINYALASTLSEQISAKFITLNALMGSGVHWEESQSVFMQCQNLLLSVAASYATLSKENISRIWAPLFIAPYLADNPRVDRTIQNQILSICQTYIQQFCADQFSRYRIGVFGKAMKSRLKIGYLSDSLRNHSVGTLAKSLFQYRDRSQFEIYGYFTDFRKKSDPIQKWYFEQLDKGHICEGMNSIAIAELVFQDQIDILIDVDSLTSFINCEVLCLKPSPIQATWLGWDATGIPTVDYFIADPYVLPNTAQDYYSEKIWRLPQTYIAVDGFEVGVPTLTRDQLRIPSTAVIYFSGQSGYKRNPDALKLQMQILKQVPNSYFLIKGRAEQSIIKDFIYEIAFSEGVNSDRLRFLPLTTTTEEHRANLAIADVVLDTYPYNGATTTLETLWMGVPIVTRVGEQFAARNSYTMMINAGIIEGIAWSDQEYVEWGVRFGLDENLRQKVVWQLRQSRKSAPLWNAKAFTKEMENAYQQMWQNYIQST